MPKSPSESLRYTLDIIEFVAPPVGQLEILTYSNVAAPDDFNEEAHKLPRLIGEEAGRRRFILTLAMYEEHWIDEGRGRNVQSRLLGRTPVYRSVWLELGDSWMRRIELAWCLFEFADGEEASLARERLQAGWNLVQMLMATEAYRFWRLKGLFAKRPQDQELSVRVSALEHTPPRSEIDPQDTLIADRMLTDLREQLESVLDGGPW